MNFGNPQRPEIMGQFVGCIEGMAEACSALDMPIVSGNVSRSTTRRAATTARPARSCRHRRSARSGLLDDWRKSATIAFKQTGDVVW